VKSEVKSEVKLDPLVFGLQLIDTGDLDPVYLALHHAFTAGSIDFDQLQRLCIAYWCYYHLGAAAQISEEVDSQFWIKMEKGLAVFPRGTERRHYRGAAAQASLRELRRRFPHPEALTRYLGVSQIAPPCALDGPGAIAASGELPTLTPQAPSASRGPRPPSLSTKTRVPFTTVVERAICLPLFGPWIAFKIADMLERVLYTPVDFSQCQLLALYREPRLGAEHIAEIWKLDTPDLALRAMIARLRVKQPRWAPPTFDRLCNVQEAETVLCKYKSYLNGHYYVGKDILEVAHGLEQYASRAGNALLRGLETCTALPNLRRKPLV